MILQNLVTIRDVLLLQLVGFFLAADGLLRYAVFPVCSLADDMLWSGITCR